MLGIKTVLHKNTGRTSRTNLEVRPGWGWRQIWCQWERRNVSIRYLGKLIYGIFWRQGYIWWKIEVSDIEGRGTYQKIRVKGGTDFTYQSCHRANWGQAHVKGEPIRGQGIRREEEGRGLSGGYRSQGDPIRNGLFPDTGKPPASVFCSHLSNKPGTLSSFGDVCTTPPPNLIEFSTKL